MNIERGFKTVPCKRFDDDTSTRADCVRPAMSGHSTFLRVYHDG